jgi:hypothetical protein
MEWSGFNSIKKQIGVVFIGGFLGFLYYSFIGCDQGCSITGSPINSTIYGTFMGLIFVWPTSKERNKK